MKITMYELLGMVKDGKKLPKKVKYAGVIFENKDGDLLNDINCSLFEHRGNECEKLLPMLNDEVEILDEKIIPEKILNDEFDELTKEAKLWKLFYKYNDLIDYLKSKGK